MTQSKYLKQNGEVIYPITLAENVLLNSGESIGDFSQEVINKTVSGIGTFTFTFIKYGRLCVVEIYLVTSAAYGVGQKTIMSSGELATKYRPLINISTVIARYDSGQQGLGNIMFGANGSITYGVDITAANGVVMTTSIAYIV